MVRYRVISADLRRDRDTILDVWRRNLSSVDKLEEKYAWHFWDNPRGEGICYLLLADDYPIGTACIGRRSLWIGSSVECSGVACDFAVDEKHRTLGPAAMLQKAVISSANPGLRLVYGAPNSNGAAAIRRMGYRYAGTVHRYVRVLRVSDYLARKWWSIGRIVGGAIDLAEEVRSGLLEQLSSRYVVEKVSTFDARFDELWARSKDALEVAAVRDSRYLEWRYAACPLKSYTTLALVTRDRSRVEGYLVYYMHGEHMVIADLLTALPVEHTNDVITSTVIEARRRGAVSLSCHCSLPPAALAALRRRGFRKRTESVSDISQGARTSPQKGEPARRLLVWSNVAEEPALHSWYFTGGDEPYN